MKKLSFKKKLFWLMILVVLIILGWWWKGNDRITGGSDIKLGLLFADGVALVSVSPDRRMINVLKFGPDMMIWIPGGLGWYRSDRVVGVLSEEKMSLDVKNLFFYNFGFNPDRIIRTASFDDWSNDLVLIRQAGWRNYLRYRLAVSGMIWREEEWLGESSSSFSLGQRWIRDFADSALLMDELKVTVVNTSQVSGLASFVASRLEWAGVTVVGLVDDDRQVENCLLLTGSGIKKEGLALTILKSYFKCQQEVDDYLSSLEAELYLGEKYAEMIKYLSYVGSF